MAILTTDLTYKGQGGDLGSNIFFEPILNAPELTSFGFDIREDIVSYEDMYLMQTSNKVTKRKTTCGWNPSGSIAELLDKRITVNELSIELEQCAKDFDGKILQTMKKMGVDRNNLEGTELQRIMVKIIEQVALEDMIRILFLGDTALVDANYNQIDGIWKKVKAAVGNNEIAAKITAPAAGTVTPAIAIDLLNDVHYGADVLLKRQAAASKRKYVSREIYDAYEQYLTENKALESSFLAMQNGVETLSHRGVPVIATDYVDAYMAEDFAAESPNRVLYTVGENITVGTDQVSDFQTVDFWYEKKPQMNFARVEYKLGVALGWGKLFSVAY